MKNKNKNSVRVFVDWGFLNRYGHKFAVINAIQVDTTKITVQVLRIKNKNVIFVVIINHINRYRLVQIELCRIIITIFFLFCDVAQICNVSRVMRSKVPLLTEFQYQSDESADNKTHFVFSSRPLRTNTCANYLSGIPTTIQ